MERQKIQEHVHSIVCKILGDQQFENERNLLGKLAAYEVLYIIDDIEKKYDINPVQLLGDLEYIDMSIEGLSNKICAILGGVNAL